MQTIYFLSESVGATGTLHPFLYLASARGSHCALWPNLICFFKRTTLPSGSVAARARPPHTLTRWQGR